jgi:hypothetical protein
VRIVGRGLGVALVALCLSVGSARAQVFVDATAAAGVLYLQRFEPFAVNQPPAAAEKATGGAAAGDYDGDGWVDLVVTRVDAPPILFRNEADGGFADVTASAGDLASAIPSGSNGVLWADVDNDGDLDLYVTAVGPTRFFLFVNQGDGTFSEEAEVRGAALASDDTHYGMSVAAGDYDRDGWLDLFVAEWWAHPAPPADPLPGRSQNRLLRNLGAAAPGFFVDSTDTAGIEVEDLPDVPTSALGTPGFSPGFVDFDGDGWPELTWVADWGNSRLFWSDGDGTFTDGTVAADVGRERAGMGSFQDDFDGDGRLDWMTTSIFGRLDEVRFGVSNQFYRNEGGRTFTNVTDAVGVADGGFGWGLSGFDYDNDGDQDVVQTNGFLEPGHEQNDVWFNDRTKLFENDGSGSFTEVGTAKGITDTGLGRSAITLDYDRDGDLDVFITNHAGTPLLYRNDGGDEGSWLQLTLEGVLSNREGIGARVTIDPDLDVAGDEQAQALLGNPGFLGHDERMLHFGLDTRTAPVDRVTVRWPSGVEQILTDVALAQRVHVTEPDQTTLTVGLVAATTAALEDGPVQIALDVRGSDIRGEPARSVALNLIAGTATPGDDFALPGSILVALPPADYRTPATISVSLPVLPDELDEADETIELTLTDPSADVLLDVAAATHTILDDDPTCPAPSDARFSLRRSRSGDRWRWKAGFDTPLELGDPTDATRYHLTIRDGTGDLVDLELVPGPVRWHATRGDYRYRDPYGVRGPVKTLDVGSESAGARIGSTAEFSARGPLGSPGPLALPIRITLTNSEGSCWRSEITTARRNDARGFSANTADRGR